MDLLTVDLGNSRCKLCAWSADAGSAPRLLDRADFESAIGLGRRVAEWIADGLDFEAGALCSVGALEIEEDLVAAIGPQVHGRFQRRPEAGLEIALLAPETVGRDRLFAARAALAVAGGSAIAVDAGTALTVDAVLAVEDATPDAAPDAAADVAADARASGSDDGTARASGSRVGIFLGGAIAPGPRLLAQALARGTARLPLVEPQPSSRALGRDTHEALQAGVATGFRGAARELVERVATEAGLESAPVVLTGGARAFLLQPPVFGARRVLVEADLVHLGLLLVLRESAEGRLAPGRSGAAS